MIRYLVLLMIFAAANVINAQTQDQTPPQPKQFVYVELSNSVGKFRRSAERPRV